MTSLDRVSKDYEYQLQHSVVTSIFQNIPIVVCRFVSCILGCFHTFCDMIWELFLFGQGRQNGIKVFLTCEVSVDYH